MSREDVKLVWLWAAMMQRCFDPDHVQYAAYGGRGITVCERWHDFRNFCADLPSRPDGLSLDRIDNDGPYSPENTRWATRQEQGGNRRNNVKITIGDRTQNLADWAREAGQDSDVISMRLKAGWDPETAVFGGRNAKRKLYTYRGKSLCVADWARETGLSECRITQRLAHGWSIERALTYPVRKSRRPLAADSLET